jgi:hypothetical protein
MPGGLHHPRCAPGGSKNGLRESLQVDGEAISHRSPAAGVPVSSSQAPPVKARQRRASSDVFH